MPSCLAPPPALHGWTRASAVASAKLNVLRMKAAARAHDCLMDGCHKPSLHERSFTAPQASELSELALDGVSFSSQPQFRALHRPSPPSSASTTPSRIASTASWRSGSGRSTTRTVGSLNLRGAPTARAQAASTATSLRGTTTALSRACSRRSMARSRVDDRPGGAADPNRSATGGRRGVARALRVDLAVRRLLYSWFVPGGHARDAAVPTAVLGQLHGGARGRCSHRHSYTNCVADQPASLSTRGRCDVEPRRCRDALYDPVRKARGRTVPTSARASSFACVAPDPLSIRLFIPSRAALSLARAPARPPAQPSLPRQRATA